MHSYEEHCALKSTGFLGGLSAFGTPIKTVSRPKYGAIFGEKTASKWSLLPVFSTSLKGKKLNSVFKKLNSVFKFDHRIIIRPRMSSKTNKITHISAICTAKACASQDLTKQFVNRAEPTSKLTRHPKSAAGMPKSVILLTH